MTRDAPLEPAQGSPTRPGGLAAAAVLVGLEGLFLCVLAVVEVASAGDGRFTLAVTTAVFFLAVGAGLLLCARGLLQVRSWARGPVVACQLIGLLLAFSFWGGGTKPVSAVLLVVSASVLVAVLHPASTRALAAAED